MSVSLLFAPCNKHLISLVGLYGRILTSVTAFGLYSRITILMSSDSGLYRIGKVFYEKLFEMRFFNHTNCEFRISEDILVLLSSH